MAAACPSCGGHLAYDGEACPCRGGAASRRSAGYAENVPPADRARTVAHLASTVMSALGHVARHVEAAQQSSTSSARDFNLQHVANHAAEATDHHRKLMSALRAFHPGAAAEFDKLSEAASPDSHAS